LTISGSRLRYQTQDNALADGIRSQILWTPFKTSFNPIKRWLNPQALIQAYNSWRINRYLEGEIDKRFDEVASLSATTSRSGSESESRSIISLALDQFLADSGGDLSPRSRRAFKDTAIPQMRMFLYAGHDTTSSTLLYVFYLLSRHPHVLDKVRAEHDAVLGPDRSAEHCQAAIASDPALVNRLPYTLAVIKEVLRVFPPAGSIRYGRPGLHLVDQEGRKYPTEDCFVWTVSLIAHHHPDNHARPEEFLPERYLVGPNDPLYPKKGTWRAFEWGPRSCLGQTLAILELKIALVLTARAFDIKPAYDELDRLNQPKGVVRAGGERAYQSELGGGGAHPADGMPVRVTLRA
jgi:cytochrome P450